MARSRRMHVVLLSICTLLFLCLYSWPAPCATTPAPPTAAKSSSPQRKKRVIAVSTFFVPFSRDDVSKSVIAQAQIPATVYLNRYFTPLINNVLNWKWLLPDWTVRVYVSRGNPFVAQLTNLGAEVVEMELDMAAWVSGMAWRFLSEDDASVEYWASREAESPPTFEDAAALQHWVSTGLPLHAIHMAAPHQTWNGGLWGARRGYISNALNASITDAIVNFASHLNATTGRRFGTLYGDDQLFMAWIWNAVNPKLHGVAYQHPSVNHSFCFFKQCLPWPDYPGAPEPRFRAGMNNVDGDKLILCHHAEAPYCRLHEYGGKVPAWRGLYELCTGLDFFTGKPVGAANSILADLTRCPYSVPSSRTWGHRKIVHMQ